MSIHVVGDRKVVEAFELIGIRGQVPNADIAALVTDLAERHHAQLVLIQSEWMTLLSEELLDHLARAFDCLVVEVPAVNRQAPDSGKFARRIQTVVGAAT